MRYTDEQLAGIEEYAAALTPIKDMAALLGVNANELRQDIADIQNPVSMVYRKAKAETKLLLRKQEIELAKVGSPLAVQLTSSYMLSMEDDEDL